MTTLFGLAALAALALAVPAVWRIARGPTLDDRLIGVQNGATLLIAALLLWHGAGADAVLLDVATVVAALGAVAVVAFDRWASGDGA